MKQFEMPKILLLLLVLLTLGYAQGSHADSPSSDKIVLRLPSIIDETAVGGGGRYLILSFKRLKKLAVFDFNAGRIVRYISVYSDDYHFAVGEQSLVVILNDKKVVERWNLETGTQDLVTTKPNWTDVRAMKMGSASAGPILIELRDGGTKWLDLKSLTPSQINFKDAPFGWGGSEQSPFSFRFSPDGTRVLGWSEGSPVVAAVLHEEQADFQSGMIGDFHVGRYFTVGSDGTFIYSSTGIFTQELVPVSPDEFGRLHCLPVQGGNFFMSVNGSSVSLYTIPDKQMLTTLPKLDELSGDQWDVEQQIFFLPSANLLVTVPVSHDQLILRHFNLMAQLNSSGIDYLFISSIPPGVFSKGQHYGYQMEVKSKHGGVKYTLDSGPPGMTLSTSGKLKWPVPASYKGREESIIIRVGDASGKEIYHTVRIHIK